MAHEIADDDKAGPDPDPHGEFSHCARLQRGDDFGDFEPRVDRSRCVVLVGAGEAEIGENAVAHELGDEAVIARHHARTGVLIGADDLAHVLGIEPSRKRGRTDEVGEHDGELAALGRVGPGVGRRRGRRAEPRPRRRTERSAPRSPT